VGSVQLDPLALAQHHVRSGLPGKALDDLRQAGADFDNPVYWRVTAAAYLGLQRPEEALGAALQGLTLDPQDVALLDMRALAELSLHEYDAALSTLDRAVSLAPRDVALLSHRALALAYVGNAVAARIAVNEVRELDPESVGVLQTRAQVAKITGDGNLGLYVGDLLAVDPENRVGHILRGADATARKDYGAMKESYEEAAYLNPSNESLAKAARSARVFTHPAMAPSRLIFTVGIWRFRFLLIAAFALLTALNHGTLQVVLFLATLALAVYTRVAPAAVRRAEARKWGDV
jgi:tetratricopeptide (TPR) repeat protein